MKTQYTITGYVYGNLWGGGRGAYPSETLQGNSKVKLLAKAKEMLKSGALDSGMGYESLIGALLTIKTTSFIEVDGKEFTNDEYTDQFIGDLDIEAMEFLEATDLCY